MESQLTGRFQVITDANDVSDDQLMGRMALFDGFGNIINPLNQNGGVAAIVVLTQEEYDALDPPGPTTLYLIQG